MTEHEFRNIAQHEEADFDRQAFFKLADNLEQRDRTRYAQIIKNLRCGEYDDFAAERYATPKIQMRNDLLAAGLTEEAQRVIDGDFDQQSISIIEKPANR